MSKMINALPRSMITPIFQKSRLAQGFNCSQDHPCPLKNQFISLQKPQRALTHHTTACATCFLHTHSLHAEAKKVFPKESFIRVSTFAVKKKFRAFPNERENKGKHSVEKYQVKWRGSPFIFHALGWFYYTVKPFYWISIIIMAV